MSIPTWGRWTGGHDQTWISDSIVNAEARLWEGGLSDPFTFSTSQEVCLGERLMTFARSKTRSSQLPVSPLPLIILFMTIDQSESVRGGRFRSCT